MSPLDITPAQYHAIAPAARADIMAQVVCELAHRGPGYPHDGAVNGPRSDIYRLSWWLDSDEAHWYTENASHHARHTTLSEAVAWLRLPAGTPLHRRRSEARHARSRQRRERLGCLWQPEREALAEWRMEFCWGVGHARHLFDPRDLHGRHRRGGPHTDPHGIPESDDLPW